ncbi:MAG: hypothetical protein UIB61_09085, partial [Treponema sp.]|nr:hypothetical protein [Treponema sp.]
MCPQKILRTGLFIASAFASEQTQAFVFADFFQKPLTIPIPHTKEILPFQQFFHLTFKQKDKQNFRRNQECNRYKKNHIFHAHHLLDFNFYDN